MIFNRKGQVAMEYMMLISFIMLCTTLIMFGISEKMNYAHEKNTNEFYEKIANLLLDQIEIALLAEDGYNSQFSVPYYVGDYNITPKIEAYFNLVLYLDDGANIIQYAKGLPKNVIGNLTYPFAVDRVKYNVKVSKENGTVTVTQCLTCEKSFYQCYNAHIYGNCGALSVADRNDCNEHGFC